MAEPVLRLEKLRKNFGGLRVTDDVTLDVMPGELHAVIGPNGAGKTTLINQISGLLAPDAGRIVFAGEDVTALPVHARARAAGWRARSRSPRSCRASPRSRMSRSPCRRARGSSFRFFGRAARRGSAERAGAWPRSPQVGLAERAHVPGRRTVAWREARARARDCARDGAEAAAARRADGRHRPRRDRAARRGAARPEGALPDGAGRARHGTRCSRSPTASRC